MLDDAQRVHLTVGAPHPRSSSDTGWLRWTTPSATHKVVVASDNLDPRFRLSVNAEDVRGGTDAGEVTLGPVAQDLVLDQSSGGATLRYAVAAAVGEGAGVDHHRVTYTLMDE